MCDFQTLALLQLQVAHTRVAVVKLRPPAGFTGAVTGLAFPGLLVHKVTSTAVGHALPLYMHIHR